jgi:hypothetical protein
MVIGLFNNGGDGKGFPSDTPAHRLINLAAQLRISRGVRVSASGIRGSSVTAVSEMKR